MVIHHAPEPGVMLAHMLCQASCWHGLGEAHDQGLKQQGEAAAWTRPGHGYLLDAAMVAFDSGQLRGQPGFVLEEVQVPPALFRGVVCLEVCLAALRTDKDAAPGKGQTNVQALLLCGKLAGLHLPRRSQTKGHLEQVGVTHGLKPGSSHETVRKNSLTN